MSHAVRRGATSTSHSTTLSSSYIRRSFAVSRFSLPPSYSIFLFLLPLATPCSPLKAKPIPNPCPQPRCLPLCQWSSPARSNSAVSTTIQDSAVSYIGVCPLSTDSDSDDGSGDDEGMRGGRRRSKHRRTRRVTCGRPLILQRDMREGTRERHPSLLRSTPTHPPRRAPPPPSLPLPSPSLIPRPNTGMLCLQSPRSPSTSEPGGDENLLDTIAH
jgi:hypothetical protein